MKVPPSPHFIPVSLENVFNANREQLDPALRLHKTGHDWYGLVNFWGIPFELGRKGQPNVIHLEREAVQVDLDSVEATYILFLHAVADRKSPLPDDLVDVPYPWTSTGNELGDLVSEYCLEYDDGSTTTAPIRRRFAIQQARIIWGASPFAAQPANGPQVTSTATEAFYAGKRVDMPYGSAETRHRSGRDAAYEQFWIYALPNPHPNKRICRITCISKDEESVIYAISHTKVREHPLRPGTRKKLKLTLPENVSLNPIGECDEIAIDLGTVISARAALAYDHDCWRGDVPLVEPTRVDTAIIVEYIAHPQARLYVATGPRDTDYAVFDLANLENEPSLVQVNSARRPVRLRAVERGSGQPVPVRLHLHGAAGEYLSPKGHHRKVNSGWFEDNYGEFVNGLNQYCYVPGECEVDLPLGQVFVEITRGYEVKPLRTSFVVNPETEEVTFELERVLHWREKGWVTADTHVHFLSPKTALLEGAAEGVNVVNLLASQWGEMFSNVGDFDGSTTFGAREFGGDGEFLVRVGTENRMQVLGHISLLGYAGAMIHPLCSGGPGESALGDALDVTMADWAEQCIKQNGLVVIPHAPDPQCERAADIVLGLVHAIEMMTFNPFNAQITPYGLADWYRYLNLGYHIPVVGGSDKMSAAMLLGGIRTYVHLGEYDFSYENWMAAIRRGNTFVTVGPLAELTVEGLQPGQVLHLPATGGTVSVTWRVESASLPIQRVEIVVGGLAAEQIQVHSQLSVDGSTEFNITESTWIALRVRGSYRGQTGDIAAHTSAVQLLVGNRPLFSQPEAISVLEQIQGAIAYVDTLAPRPDATRFKKLRATLESAYSRLHMQLHRQGVYHQHIPIHRDDESNTE